MIKSIQLTIDGVSLKTNTNSVSFYPDDTQPYDHQEKMADILTSDEDAVAVNTAPTGGGKTWSWSVPVIENEMSSLVVLPTNALISDQYSAIKEYEEKYIEEDSKIGYQKLTGQTAMDLKNKWGSQTKGEAISEEIKSYKDEYDSIIFLTNPDIFTYLRRGRYKGSLAKNSTNEFDSVIFDEFHLADTKGWNSLLFLVDEMYASDNSITSKFVFLSATPEEEVEHRLKESLEIDNYQNCSSKTRRENPINPGRRPYTEVENETDWRAVMPPVETEFRPGHTFFTGGHITSDDVIQNTVNFVTQGRTVIMLDSLKEVDIVHEKLTQALPNKDIYRIDGFNKNNIESKLDDFDVLVSNSAVEVGIDFDVDQIIMSGYTQSRFLQRLGRLRNKSKKLRAIAYVPESVYDGIAKAKRMYGDATIKREIFRNKIKDWFPEPENPSKYSEKYSAIEALIHSQKKQENMTSKKKKEYKPESYKRIANHFFKPNDVEVSYDKFQDLINKARSPLNNTDGNAFHDTITSYRNSGLNTLVYKIQEGEVLSYNVFYLLKSGDIEFVSEDEFFSRIPHTLYQKARAEASHSIGYCIYNGKRRPPANLDEESTRKPRISVSNTLREITKLPPEKREPVSIKGLTIKVEDDIRGLEKFNNQMKQKEFLCYPIEGNSYDIQQQYNLNSFFFLRSLTDLRGNYSLAMGLNALYLHCHVLKRAENYSNKQNI